MVVAAVGGSCVVTGTAWARQLLMWRRVVRAFSTRSRRARQERLQGQDEQALDYVANRKFAKSLEHAPSVAALHETVRREVEADGLDSRLMTPRNVSMIVYRVGQLHHLLGDAHDDGFRNMVVDLVDRNMLKFMTPSLSSLIRSIGDWSLWEKPPGLCTQIARHLFVQPKLRAPTLCRALPGMATVGVTDDDIWNNALKCFQLCGARSCLRVVASLTVCAPDRQLPHMNGDQLSPCLHAVVRTGRGDVDFFTVMSNHVKLRAFSYDSRCVGQLSMSFARAKDRCPDLTSLFDHLAQQVTVLVSHSRPAPAHDQRRRCVSCPCTARSTFAMSPGRSSLSRPARRSCSMLLRTGLSPAPTGSPQRYCSTCTER